jgi:hypothetical protein
MLPRMSYLILKATVSCILIAIASGVARKLPGIGTLVAPPPLVSVVAMI